MDIETFIQRFAAGLAELEGLAPAAARARYDALCADFSPPDPAGLEVADERLAGVAVRRLIPAAANAGRVLFVHGGGFTLGSPRSHHGVAASLAVQLNREVVSVDYRLAPEVGYATMLADCRAVAEAIAPLALVGDSAGGRLVLDLARELPAPTPPLGLIYPPLGGLDGSTLGPDAPLLSRNDVLSIRRLCPAALPMIAEMEPPSRHLHVLTVEHDPLTAPLEAAVDAWRNAGAEVVYRCAPGMVHAALHAHALLPTMHSAWQDFCQALKARL
ncbi:alpha/beta hydrolase fold domain-containing protein [Halomonas sp. ML-15]|uniref:alpha/beta hydrolase fold domain-containing protein n=1 Tax=Halomonas sp. ML-15 TaxID=2773305 RepID=UPI0017475989|nr:alpha/beta hydrolase fold domain-containing protein [Halomonas sp. ML-15]MBD3897966.1 alpha/beta hydrolase fold domain-containing protein [Halomonas sp. ML-15]